MVHDFAAISESFVFAEIDGKGLVFSQLAGALSAQCQAYFLRKSLYGVSSADAFQVNTGSTINTPATIAAGQANALVNVRLSPFAEFVNIFVTKYAINATLPQVAA
jgi:hypothetical protein